jgi:hypothetical protein
MFQYTCIFLLFTVVWLNGLSGDTEQQNRLLQSQRIEPRLTFPNSVKNRNSKSLIDSAVSDMTTVGRFGIGRERRERRSSSDFILRSGTNPRAPKAQKSVDSKPSIEVVSSHSEFTVLNNRSYMFTMTNIMNSTNAWSEKLRNLR